MAKKTKTPKTTANPVPARVPVWDRPLIDGSPMAWRFSSCDRGGPFNWAAIEGTGKLADVMNRMAGFEKMNWDAIMRAGNHPIKRDRLGKSARDRLSEIGQDDIDELMSFRISGENRVWCIRDRNIMRVLWWDPEHQVYPVERDKADRRKHRPGQGGGQRGGRG